MAKLADILKAIQQNPDDMTQLPQLIVQIEQLETAEFAYLERIAKLQEYNKAYLAQIPVTFEDPNKATIEEPPAPPTLADARESIITMMTGGN